MLKSKEMALLWVFGLLLATVPPLAQANPSTCERLPDAVLTYLKTLEPNLKVREDCLAVLNQNLSYLPILPQGHESPLLPSRMVRQFPEKSKTPEWVEFDNGFYLLRLLETENGKITLTRSETIPERLKTGLIPQNFMMPAGFSIPNELRILVGDLPYETPLASTVKSTKEKETPLEKVSQTLTPDNIVLDPLLFTASIQNSQLTAWDAFTWKPKWSYNLGCLGTSAVATPTGEFLYVNCLNSPRIQVIDIKSQQCLNELEMANISQKLVGHDFFPMVLAVHRYAPQFTILDSEYHLIRHKVELPFVIDDVAVHSRLPIAYGVHANGNQIVELDLQNGQVLRTFDLQKSMPAYKVKAVWIDARKGKFGTLWLMSRDTATLYAVDLLSGTLIKTLKSETPFTQVGFVKQENNERLPLLFTQDAPEKVMTIQWQDGKASLTEGKPIASLASTNTRRWMSFTSGVQANELIGVEAVSEKAYRLVWNAETQELTMQTPLVKNLKTFVLNVVEQPNAESLALLKTKRDAFAPSAEEAETLTNLRSQPKYQNGLLRLGGWLKFAPRDQ